MIIRAKGVGRVCVVNGVRTTARTPLAVGREAVFLWHARPAASEPLRACFAPEHAVDAAPRADARGTQPPWREAAA